LDYYRIRGFDASFNTYIDGLRERNGMNEETFGLESVEVMKGPSSTLYGQSVLAASSTCAASSLGRRICPGSIHGGSYGFTNRD